MKELDLKKVVFPTSQSPNINEQEPEELINICDEHSEKPISARSRNRSPYSIPCSSSTSILTTSETDTEHLTRDIESEGIPILQEAIDTKPKQILVFT